MSNLATKCPICNSRKPKRLCPARGDAICPVCCGREREVSIRCPFDCEFLREARKHEQLAELEYAALPNKDVELTDRFLDEHALLGQYLSEILWTAISQQPSAVDSDVREALDALVRTYRTLDTGLVYETRPDNPYAAAIAARVRERLQQMQEQLREQTGMSQLRDREILGMLVFFQRTELQVNNGRRMGRAFIDVLRQNHADVPSGTPVQPETPSGGSLLIP